MSVLTLTREEERGLTLEEVNTIIPAIMIDKPAEKMSKSYDFVSTKDLVSKFMDAGWHIHKATYADAPSTKGLGRHIIALRQDGLTIPGTEDQYEIRIVNSYNGRVNLSITLGVHRLVCSNGLVAFSPELKPFVAKHTGQTASVIAEEAIGHLFHQVQILETEISKWKSLSFTPIQEKILARDFLLERLDKMPTTKQIEDVLKVNRPEDKGNSIWVVFNRLQENVLKGNFVHKKSGKEIKAKVISNPQRDMDLNKAFWQMTTDLVTDVIEVEVV